MGSVKVTMSIGWNFQSVVTAGGLRFVWDRRSVNRDIKADRFLIPRVEDLIERISRLKHEVNAKGITEMWVSTLDLRTSF